MDEYVERAVDRIVNDLSDRRGLKQEWRQIEPEIRKEIMETWRQIVAGEMKAYADEVRWAESADRGGN